MSWSPADGLRFRGAVPVTTAWVALLLATYAAQAAVGPAGWLAVRTTRQRIAAGGMYAPLVESGAGWRLWTCLFVHVDPVHLLSNALAVWVLGRILEPMVGGWRLSAWFLAGGVCGAALSKMVGHLASDGASGGAFALLGAAMALGWRYRRELPPDDARLLGPVLGVFLALNLVLSLLPFIDLVAHLGGLATGALLAASVGTRRGEVLLGIDVGWVLASVAIGAYGFWRVMT